MMLRMGVFLFFAGLLGAVLGNAPVLSPAMWSLPMIIFGGLCLAAGTFLMLFASAKAMDTSDSDPNDLIHP